MIEWPQDLIRDVARRRSVLFLGAGVSKNASNHLRERPMNWDEFLASLASHVPLGEKRSAIEQCIAEGDLLTACEVARKALRNDRFKEYLLQEYSNKKFQYSAVHENIVRIDSRIVATTNFDKLYEMAASTILLGAVLVKTYYDDDIADVVRRQQRFVLKIHGTIDASDKTIFTRNDYANARTENQEFYRVLEALFLTHTFIFLGASMRDPDIRLVLEDYAYRHAGSRPHFMVMPSGAPSIPVLEVLEESMNLRTISYDPKDNHAELAAGIADLVTLVEAEREALGLSLDW